MLRPPFDYGDLIYDRAFNESFQNKLESVQQQSQELLEVPPERAFPKN